MNGSVLYYFWAEFPLLERSVNPFEMHIYFAKQVRRLEKVICSGKESNIKQNIEEKTLMRIRKLYLRK